ncbi:MAG: S-methyl-5-thioribose-1-phosphate isomerase [Anaerolineae bacterium]|jgi:methylthioribose-1-phosphate isomerase|nr:S-methyl-5-thioribose-1-phosphate isomerase [Anaerolineae bacterium]
MADYYSIKWLNGAVSMIDQRLLPHEVKYNTYTTYEEVAKAINVMVVRGAPAIGASAAYGMLLAVNAITTEDVAVGLAELKAAGEVLKAARPTAVNLFWAVDRVYRKAESSGADTMEDLRAVVKAEADLIWKEDAEMCFRIAENAMQVTPDQVIFVHHCNTGALATVDYGTALGVIRRAHEVGKEVFAYVDETRPRLQGARLTSWELRELGVPHAVIVDGASGYVMKNKGVNMVVFGCDRIAANGDVANKIGTYNLALAAKAHGIPAYSVGPTSTIDLDTPTGDLIDIEERPGDEVSHVFGKAQITPEGVDVFNPAFDVTPNEIITGIITEEGIAYPPYEKSLAEMVRRAEERRKGK